MRSNRCSILLCLLLAYLAGGCASSEDTEPSSIEDLPYAVGVVSSTLEDVSNVLNERNEEIKADWFIHEVQIEPEGRIHLNMEVSYDGVLPDSRKFLGSAILLELFAQYVFEEQGLGRRFGSRFPIWFSPVPLLSGTPQHAEVICTGFFDPPGIQLGAATTPLRWLGVATVWIRLYQDRAGVYYYEWVAPSEYLFEQPDTLKVGPTYREISGSFGIIYHPLPESETHPVLLINLGTPSINEETPQFNYVHWMKEHLLQKEGIGR